MKTRPLIVAAHRVDVSCSARSTIETDTAGPVAPAAALSGVVPSGSQSPHVTWKSPVHSLHCSRNSSSDIEPMPCVFVRSAGDVVVPTNIVRCTTGSEMIGT